LVDRELTKRTNSPRAVRRRTARLKQSAALNDIDWRNPHGLDRLRIQSLATCQWMNEHLNVLVTGPLAWAIHISPARLPTKPVAKIEVLMLDDQGIAPLIDTQRRDAFELLPDVPRRLAGRRRGCKFPPCLRASRFVFEDRVCLSSAKRSGVSAP
jgi:hypothetical protein